MLADVMAEAEPTGFRERLLGETLRLAGRRRRMRQFRRLAGALTVLVVVALLAWRLGPPAGGTVGLAAATYVTVQTESLPTRAIIRTQPLDPSRLTASVASIDLVHTTANSGQVQTIGDDELLALAAPRPAALVRTGPHAAKLVFANTDEQEYVPLN